MTTYQYSDPVKRELSDQTPIVFEWLRAGVTPTIEVALDNVTFVPALGSVTEITVDTPRYRINYHTSDRPTSPGIITYKITEGGDTAYLEVQITPTSSPGNGELDASSLTTLIQTLGPRRVKTKDMEIEAHSIDKVQKVLERTGPKVIGLNAMRWDIVKPKQTRDRGYCD